MYDADSDLDMRINVLEDAGECQTTNSRLRSGGCSGGWCSGGASSFPRVSWRVDLGLWRLDLSCPACWRPIERRHLSFSLSLSSCLANVGRPNGRRASLHPSLRQTPIRKGQHRYPLLTATTAVAVHPPARLANCGYQYDANPSSNFAQATKHDPWPGPGGMTNSQEGSIKHESTDGEALRSWEKLRYR